MQIKTKSVFSAAHRIEGHKKCGQTHGHNYTLWLTVSLKDTKAQIEVDFDDLKIILDGVTSVYDHTDLGNKSSEELVREISGKLKKKLKEQSNFTKIDRFNVEIWESDNFGILGEWVDI